MKTITLLLCLALVSCQNNKTNAQTMDTQSPEYKAYMAQQHRFALNGCELTYNEKPFYIGMSLEELKRMFGKNSIIEKGINDYNVDPYFLFYPKKGIMSIIENNMLRDIYIYKK